jgi:hypothetical protein
LANEMTTVGRKRAIAVKRLAQAEPPSDHHQSEALLALQRALVERLTGTRAEFQEAVTCYSVRIQGVLAHVSDVLNETAAGLSEDETRSRERTLRRALDHVESLELKPAKGRRRDLKAVEALATDLVAAMADW